MKRVLLLLLVAIAVGVTLLVATCNPASLIAEKMAAHVGVLAYLYGYPLVDMQRQMHNETHRVADGQQVLAAVNRMYRFPHLITPETAGNFRAPNSDTLYFTAWYDISREPLIIHTPDTGGRYYTIAVTNQYSEVTHIGRRTTGTHEQYFALVSPLWIPAAPGPGSPRSRVVERRLRYRGSGRGSRG